LLFRIKGTIEEWPTEADNFEVELSQDNTEDELIEKIAVHSINEYLGKNEQNKNEDILQRVMFLKYLLYSYKYFSKNEFIYTNEIRNHLLLNSIRTSDYYIRSRIVAPLRDEGVLIASSSRGYKIPVSKNDVVKYIQHSKGIIEPMVKRLKTMQKTLLLGSGGSIDIYENYGFPQEIKK
jgi:hypothetical protein